MINSKDVAEFIAASHNLTKTEAEAVINDAFAYIADCLGFEGEVNLHKFGRFSQKTRPARKGRNPKTGEEILIPEKTTIKFTPAKALREKVSPQP